MTTDTGMVEQCARAAFLRDRGYDLSDPVGLEDWRTLPQVHDRYRDSARAVLECLRTPTPEMVEAGRERMDYDDFNDEFNAHVVGRVFQAMIDRALSPSKGEGE